ncbi:PREDICTED: pentatricopeptide repeat-containing protein At4g21705, mitochondrial [Brassica oleracea var. oleracea]|uniref:Pentacotripeptide-repeat region of PRORP domain-containing protein n=1 Tax=Brassica oleracea var. oleracea TaxID=109376 RepID=A0A0D3DFA3_BRAOL|nr:PREDICTED: pentatricopeptide repeat-containing protein At4g21705, mitochondrial [Brassica oleracea var. oleracea]
MNILRRIPANLFTSRYYYTNRVKRTTLYSKISPLGNPKSSVYPELQNWVHSGNKVSVAELIRIVHDLRRRKRFLHALEVSKWMNDTGVCIFSPSEHAVHLDLVGRVHGFVSAEAYFESLKEQHKNDKTHGALLNCYVRQLDVEKSLSHFEKMKQLGYASSPLTYNNIMCLYTNIGQHDKVPRVLDEMKEENVAPDNYSFRICINAFGVMNDLERIGEILSDMETVDWNTYAVAAKFYIDGGDRDKAVELLRMSESRLESKDGEGYSHLITLYARLGDKGEVLRLWELEKDACKRRINQDYLTVLQSLVKIDALKEAEEVVKEWESSSGNCYDFRVPSAVIRGYAGRGMEEKAEAMLEDLGKRGKGTTPDSWGLVAAAYVEKGVLDNAYKCLKTALDVEAGKRKWRPWVKVVTNVLSWLGNEGSLREVESFVASLRSCMGVNREMYHALVKADIREGGSNVDTLLQRMKEDKIETDEETMAILSTRSHC